jgi:N-acetylmuramoyl-L-alanine amidase
MRLPYIYALLLALAAPAGAQGLIVAENDLGYLNLRSGPGTQHAVLERMRPGDRVAVLETLGRWARVRSPGGGEGWASLDFLERAGALAKRVPLYVGQDHAWLNLRAGPSTETAILRRMYPGDRLEPLEQNGVWVRIRHISGAVGWAHSDYVTR